MTQQLRIFAVLVGDRSSVPSSHMVVDLHRHKTHTWYTYIQGYILIHKNKQIYISVFFYTVKVFILAFPTINMASEHQVPFFLFELPFCLTNSLLSFQTLFLSRSPMICIALHLEHTLINLC